MVPMTMKYDNRCGWMADATAVQAGNEPVWSLNEALGLIVGGHKPR